MPPKCDKIKKTLQISSFSYCVSTARLVCETPEKTQDSESPGCNYRFGQSLHAPSNNRTDKELSNKGSNLLVTSNGRYHSKLILKTKDIHFDYFLLICLYYATIYVFSMTAI